MRIKDVEIMVGITKKNIRFYEKEGLLTPGRNKDNSYRDYDMDDVTRLKEIKLFRKIGMPINEIRDILEERISLPVASRKHLAYLEGEIYNISKARTLCQMIMEDGSAHNCIDVESYLDKMENMEREGVLFVNIQNRDVAKKYVGPAVACATVLMLMAAIIVGILYGNSVERMPTVLLVILISLPSIVSIGTIAALISRIKEIRGGEENDLGNY